MKKVTVVMPHYNKLEALRETLPLWQEAMDEYSSVIVVDDWSRGNLPEIGGVRYVRPPRRSRMDSILNRAPYRLSTLCNTGCRHTTGDIIIKTDPDIIPPRDIISRVRKSLKPNVLMTGRIDHRDPNGKVKSPDRRDVDNGESYYTDNFNVIWGGMIMFFRERMSMVGWFSQEYDGTWGQEDADLAAKAYHSGMQIKYNAQIISEHIWHPKLATSGKTNDSLLRRRCTHYEYNLGDVTPYRPTVLVLTTPMIINTLSAETIPLRFLTYDDGRGDKPRWAVLTTSSPTLFQACEIAKDAGYEQVIDARYIDNETYKPGMIEQLANTARAYRHTKYVEMDTFTAINIDGKDESTQNVEYKLPKEQSYIRREPAWK